LKVQQIQIISEHQAKTTFYLQQKREAEDTLMSKREHICCLLLIPFLKAQVQAKMQNTEQWCRLPDGQTHWAPAVPHFLAWDHLPHSSGHHLAFSWLLCTAGAQVSLRPALRYQA